jgi:hypothetical protein
MKPLATFAITAIALISGVNAYAQSTSSSLTRADVYAQLVQAQADGILPYHRTDYPPSPATIARNKELYVLRHRHDQTNATASAQSDTSGSRLAAK